ncbi:translation elongation factor Ts [Gloeothece citriformis PCC 7424]|uniref:Elongation factor Ts n=1 Tax=Gloeothece citriformis (strain PCC 7424) TaxID=65393 RepID=EFTS_GLOC7|nr:translation elongation factor Ts [Gloeothece citriformis]B7K735.1 RecName: Full=Elongation factor Ts; Short=EF-Ts [Gloeothece citriformis PCC 7424]ACK69603.1 translation elongation factor Ts [Gloeothece citriformis PCC 7424]
MAEITAKLVKELREKTGAGMMDCKKALGESGGDMEKATEWLRQKGITSAEKKSGRITAEGLIHSYIHTGGRIGVLVELNCETDFVARGDTFKDLVNNIAMQIAACPNVEYVRVEDIPEAVAQKEKEIEKGRDDLAGKPENIKDKIVEGRIGKRLKELSLMDQPYIKDQSITVAELIKQTIAQIGENIQVRRFVRFVLGEGIEKEEKNFAEEVAAQTGQKVEQPQAAQETAKVEPPTPETVEEVEPPVTPPAQETDSPAAETTTEPPKTTPVDKPKGSPSKKGKKKK